MPNIEILIWSKKKAFITTNSRITLMYVHIYITNHINYQLSTQRINDFERLIRIMSFQVLPYPANNQLIKLKLPIRVNNAYTLLYAPAVLHINALLAKCIVTSPISYQSAISRSQQNKLTTYTYTYAPKHIQRQVMHCRCYSVIRNLVSQMRLAIH